jgi:transposase InsO family protein
MSAISSIQERGIPWHERCGQPGRNVMAQLERDGLVPPQASAIKHCQACILGKLTDVPRADDTREWLPCRNMTTPYSTDDAKRSSQALGMSASRHPRNMVWSCSDMPLQCLHTDLSFPGVEAFDQSRCSLTVIDAAIRYSWCVPLKLKSAAAYEFQCLIKHLEQMFGPRMGMFQSGQGGEFSSKLLATWFRDCGVVMRMTLTVASTSNGLIERLHGTLWSRTHAVMTAGDVLFSLWPVIVQGVNYLCNRLPTMHLHGASPWARLNGRPVPCLEHLRVLGAPCVVRMPKA